MEFGFTKATVNGELFVKKDDLIHLLNLLELACADEKIPARAIAGVSSIIETLSVHKGIITTDLLMNNLKRSLGDV